MAGVAPNLPIHQDGRIEALHIITIIDVGTPPVGYELVLELNAKGSKIVGTLQPTIDLGTGKDKTTTLAERNDLIHRKSRHGTILSCSSAAVRQAISRGRQASGLSLAPGLLTLVACH